MALSLQLGYPDIPLSITNPNVNINDALDNGNPMPFLTFIKLTAISFEPDTLQAYYNYYLKIWNNKTNSKEVDNNSLIVESYREFIRDISLNYTTPEEKQFLSNIDFNDPYDLDVVIGFYGSKLKELALFYNNKRNDVKFNLIRNKLRGTTFGIEKTISELALSYLKTLDDGKILYDWNIIKSKIEIEIEELYDTYPLYFNQTPDSKIYDKKDLDYGYNIFLKDNTTIISTILSGMSLSSLQMKEIDQLLDNKRLLTEKYMSTDFYYLSTGNTITDFVSGQLFKAKNPSGNLQNRDYPTTASTQQSAYLEPHRARGFFIPSKVSIIFIDGKTSSFQINTANLSPNSLYYFPDPSIIGSNGEVLTFIVDDSALKRNYSSGNIANQPYSHPNDTKYYGYVSKIDQNTEKYLDLVFDAGFIKDIKTDIYSNLFGLFKNDHRFRQTIQTNTTPVSIDLLLNGYNFYDETFGEEYNFNFTTENLSSYGETIRTGLSTNTAALSTPYVDYTLFLGYFTPFRTPIAFTDPNLITHYQILEGAYITAGPDPVSTDSPSFSASTDSFYFSDLLDGGIYSIGPPIVRALSSLSADFTKTTRTSAIEVIDGGIFVAYPDLDFNIVTSNYKYDDTVYNTTQTNISTFPIIDSYELDGKLMIKNSSTREVNTLLTTLPYIQTNHLSSTLIELANNVINFELVVDILIIETPHYLTIDKIVCENGNFVDPKAGSYNIEHSTGNFDKISNRFKIDRYVYFCKMNTLSGNTIIYPEIYIFDTINFKSTLLFPRSPLDVTDFFSISGGGVSYIAAEFPTLTHNSRNNIFNISFLMKDQNNMPRLHEMDFQISSGVEFLSHTINNMASDHISNDLSTLSNLNIVLSSASPLNILDELII